MEQLDVRRRRRVHAMLIANLALRSLGLYHSISNRTVLFLQQRGVSNPLNCRFL